MICLSVLRLLAEAMRKYPFPSLLRKCVKDYKIPGTNLVIEKGVGLVIPTYSLHRDPKYYPNPMIFNPDRFDKDNSEGKNQINRPFLAFGDGPRSCIGQRLAQMQTKVGLIMMLQEHKFDLVDELKNGELIMDPKSIITIPKGGLRLHVSKR